MGDRREDGAEGDPWGPAGPARGLSRAFGKTLAGSGPEGLGAGEGASAGESAGPYLLAGEIARGGMGTVYQAHDPDLDREVAVKILLESHRDQPAVVRRFWEEARIGGMLQHPGTVPVYGVGVDGRFRPFFAMKLVRGRTLAQLLRERPAAGAHLERFLGTFEQVCQTIAYAHARKVIHRDLKPSNIMVGEFGETQVMDWGLAKRLPAPDPREEGGAGAASRAGEMETDADMPTYPLQARQARASEAPADPTVSSHGSVLGTPPYMPPEQARGELDRLDERSDVFALGAILCEILTGSPPYEGSSTTEVLRKAHEADLGECFARLGSCAADPELAALAAHCLAPAREDRPADAREVAEAIASYRGRVQGRLREAELARASALAKAEEEHKRRKLSIFLMATMIALLLVTGTAAARWAWRVHAQTRRAEGELGEAIRLAHEARGQPESSPRWLSAVEAIGRVEALLDDSTPADLVARVAELRARMDEAAAASARSALDQAVLGRLIEIRAELEDAGPARSDESYAEAFARLGISADGDHEAGARELRSRPGPVRARLIAALDDWASVRRMRHEAGGAWERPLALAERADDDPYRNAIRARMMAPDRAEAAEALRGLARDPRAAQLPAASAVLLARALRESGDARLAADVLRAAAGREPGDVWVDYDLAQTLMALDPPEPEEAIRYYSMARALRPETAHKLAHLLLSTGRPGEGLELFADLAARRPGDIWNATCYARTLRDQGDAPGAAAAFGRAAANCRERLERDPRDPEAGLMLGIICRESGDLAGAIAALRDAVRRHPEDPEARDELASALEDRGDLAGAVEAIRGAIRLRPGDAGLQYNLGIALSELGDHAGAIAAYRESIRLRPGFAEAHCNLGHLLRDRGRYPEAIEALRRGHELGSKGSGWGYSSGRWIEHAERLAALERRLPAILRGEGRPGDAPGLLDLAEACANSGRNAEAARAYADAFAADPALADGREEHHRDNAAHAAARAAGDPTTAEPARSAARRRALGWLREELGLREQQLGLPEGDKGHIEAARTLARWQADPDLGPLRPPRSLAALPPGEFAEWRAFWDRVAALRAEAGPGAPVEGE